MAATPLTTLGFGLALAASVAQARDCTDDAMIVFDGSGSMAEVGFNLFAEPRIFEARRAVGAVVPEVAAVRRLGLVVYGPGGSDACAGVDLRFRPVRDAAPRIVDAVDALQPEGDTALTAAVRLAAETLGGPGEVVLVTDGKETCGGEPCRLAAELRDGPVVHVIGFKVRGDFFEWKAPGAEVVEVETVARCLADGTGGMYVAAETVEELTAALRRTLGCNLLF